MRAQRPGPSRCKGTLYTIQPGDTLYSIAQEALLPVEVLLEANPTVDPLNLQVGSTICIPSLVVPPCPGGFIWVVERGDTIYRIAQMTGKSVREILQANPGVNPYNLRPGTRLCIPG
ncbi:LysM peptidoglycan-binding domain-containing protein [Zhaonella formicivorans]|uniref:LysM peptidoglycan-binding domain-containing protein n=1 Tax=Zhaonella formicivorans TaxID=2528593 RepID=UPI0010DADF69|nr:LysM domain-containing protein [Zhaonella formicivorans]